MIPWLDGFLIGIVVGVFLAITVSMVYIRRWIVSSSVDKKMCEGLITRLARVDKQKSTYKEALEKSVRETEQLRGEKFRKWDIPDRM